MKTKHPSLFTSLLRSATESVRRLFIEHTPPHRNGLTGARAEILDFRAKHVFDATGHIDARFLLDALIEPATPDATWQPGDLTLLPSAAAATLVARGQRADDLCRVLSAEVLEARRFQPAADRTCTGTRRVRLSLRIRPGLAQLCFRHGSALFGNVVLPDAALLAA